MGMSKLVTYTSLSQYYEARTKKAKKIAIHHMAGNLTVEGCGSVFHTAGVSTHYGINGTRIGGYVNEDYRAFSLGDRAADMEVINIELANDGGAPDWHVSDVTIETCIRLCVDICERNGIEKINYTGDKSGNLIQHRWYVSTECPGNYLASKFPYIASEINKRLEAKKERPLTYRVHQQTYGWSKWYNAGEWAGVKGESKRIEAIQIDPGTNRQISAKVHIQGIGDVDYGIIDKNRIIGTTGQSKRLELIELKGAKIQCHIQTIGDAADYGPVQGTKGLGKRIESIRMI